MTSWRYLTGMNNTAAIAEDDDFMPIFDPIPDSADSVSFEAVREALVTALSAVRAIRTNRPLKYWASADAIDDVANALTAEIGQLTGRAEEVFDDEREQEARSAEWRRCHGTRRLGR